MKKFIILSALLISACSTLVNNENCLQVSKFKVFQTVDDGALAYECTATGECSPENQAVFLEEQNNVEYYDGMIVDAPKGKCAIHNGVYKYENTQGTEKTVPVIRFEYKNTLLDE